MQNKLRGLELWCLTPLSPIFQLCRGGFIGGENWSTRRNLPICTDKLYQIMLYRVHLV